jgi:hypothetical protein
MIQPTIENKYRLDMQVSPRVMDCRDRSPSQRNDSTARSVFEILDPWIALTNANHGLKREPRMTATASKAHHRCVTRRADRIQPKVGGAVLAGRSDKPAASRAGEPSRRACEKPGTMDDDELQA